MVRLTDRPDMTLDVYRGRKTTTQQQQLLSSSHHLNITRDELIHSYVCRQITHVYQQVIYKHLVSLEVYKKGCE